MKKILVTGGGGYIGTTLVPLLLSKGYDVTVYDNLMYGGEFMLSFANHSNFKLIVGDVTNHKKINSILNDFDVVIHLAGITDAPSTLDSPEKTFRSNFDGVWNVLSVSMNDNVKKFLFPSTTSVYGEAEGVVDENSPEEIYKPATPYAEAKRKAEIKANKLKPTYTIICSVSAR